MRTGNSRRLSIISRRRWRVALGRASNTSVMMVDVDKFKNVNDTYGHQVGDRVLKDIGNVFSGVLREADFVGRLGGEEFAVFLPEGSARQEKAPHRAGHHQGQQGGGQLIVWACLT